MLNKRLEIRKHILLISSSNYHVVKALDLLLDEIERLSKEEQRLTEEIVELKLAAKRNI